MPSCALGAPVPRDAGSLSPRTAVSTTRKEHVMSKVVAIMSMSLDGYVADLNDGVAEVFP